MKNFFKKSIFIFRRDLRIHDNTGLIKASESSGKVIPCFIFDPRQVENNPYRSDNAFQFMIESITNLKDEIEKLNGRLYLFYGKQEEIIDRLIRSHKIEAVFINRDYTPFSINRDSNINNLCVNNGISFFSEPDYLLTEPEEIMTKEDKPYTIFTHFFKKTSEINIREPQKTFPTNFETDNIEFEIPALLTQLKCTRNENIHIHGSRDICLHILNNISNYKDYDKFRDYPANESTTNLSAFIKFGVCSIREVYWTINDELEPSHPLIRQLFWRDFFTHIAFHFPHVFGESFHKKFDTITWNNNEALFSKWREGKTGFPIVDAGIRQLNSTGFMHNRIRMITASFLTKDLHIDWRWGEKYFAKKLVDYDPCVNNGNWQWSSSTGCDAQPYFRIFNPWLQQKKFDPECIYIKKWIPELKNIPAKNIHNIFDMDIKGYPKPIIDHKTETNLTRNIFSNVS